MHVHVFAGHRAKQCHRGRHLRSARGAQALPLGHGRHCGCRVVGPTQIPYIKLTACINAP